MPSVLDQIFNQYQAPQGSPLESALDLIGQRGASYMNLRNAQPKPGQAELQMAMQLLPHALQAQRYQQSEQEKYYGLLNAQRIQEMRDKAAGGRETQRETFQAGQGQLNRAASEARARIMAGVGYARVGVEKMSLDDRKVSEGNYILHDDGTYEPRAGGDIAEPDPTGGFNTYRVVNGQKQYVGWTGKAEPGGTVQHARAAKPTVLPPKRPGDKGTTLSPRVADKLRGL